MRFGAHVNAHTSFDETVYQLQIPTDNPAVIDRSLLILEDWAHTVSFEPQEIDKERGVILEEWRLGLGRRRADAGRAAAGPAQGLALRRAARRSASRRSSGTSSHDRLKQFYTDWYRPDLMAVIVVGDFDQAAIEAQIKSHFVRDSRARRRRRPRPVYNVPDQPGTLYSVATDPEATQTTVSVSSTMAARDQTTLGALPPADGRAARSAACCPAGFDEIARQAERAVSGRARPTARLFVRSPTEATTLDALVARRRRRERARRRSSPRPIASPGSASPQTELDRYRLTLLKAFEQLAVVERTRARPSRWPTSSSATSCSSEPIPGIAYEYALSSASCRRSRWPKSTALAVDWMPDRNRVVAVSAPEKDGVAVPDEAALAAAIKGATAAAR